ncbi:MAG TPA: glycosyltransferase family 2 protein [Rhizomicrobium sp.]|nr:glycosyltransferase family 2 protein [Rhizomicrobium sp.]
MKNSVTDFSRISDVELSVVIVTHGAREMTLDCLESVAIETRRLASEVLVVDNASENGLAREIAARFPHFHVVAQFANLGFAAAANLAADFARGRFLLFLNPDTIVADGALDRLLEFARARPGAGIWGGRTLYGDGAVNPTSCRRAPSLWSLLCSAFALDTRYPQSRLFAAMGYGGWQRDRERSVDVVCGCFLLVDRAVWHRLAGFSPAFFMYGEDDDLCMRARQAGFHPAFTPAATIIHYGSGTELNQDRKIGQILASRALLIRSHFPMPARPLAALLLMLRPWLGSRFGRPSLRPLWRSIWARRSQWIAGRFA